MAECTWPSDSYRWLPPLPLPPPSNMYLTHLREDPVVVRTDQLGFETTPDASDGDSIDESVEARCLYVRLASNS